MTPIETHISMNECKAKVGSFLAKDKLVWSSARTDKMDSPSPKDRHNKNSSWVGVLSLRDYLGLFSSTSVLVCLQRSRYSYWEWVMLNELFFYYQWPNHTREGFKHHLPWNSLVENMVNMNYKVSFELWIAGQITFQLMLCCVIRVFLEAYRILSGSFFH